MKPALLCSLFLSACVVAANYRLYAVTWTCLSPEGCESAEEVALIDRADIINGDEFVEFRSSRDANFELYTQMVPSDELPAGCSWLHSFKLFATEAEPARFCRTSGRFELELSLPNRDPATHSRWLAEGREIDP
jgi:hypothetical protein